MSKNIIRQEDLNIFGLNDFKEWIKFNPDKINHLVEFSYLETVKSPTDPSSSSNPIDLFQKALLSLPSTKNEEKVLVVHQIPLGLWWLNQVPARHGEQGKITKGYMHLLKSGYNANHQFKFHQEYSGDFEFLLTFNGQHSNGFINLNQYVLSVIPLAEPLLDWMKENNQGELLQIQEKCLKALEYNEDKNSDMDYENFGADSQNIVCNQQTAWQNISEKMKAFTQADNLKTATENTTPNKKIKL